MLPDFQTLMLPLLRFAADGKPHNLREAREHFIKLFSMTEAEIEEMLPSGRSSKFYNRTAWAKSYLQQAGLLDSPVRGQYVITSSGQALLKKPPERITINYLLANYPKFQELRSRTRGSDSLSKATEEPTVEEEVSTPEELLATAYTQIRAKLHAEIREKIQQNSPTFFENLVVELLVKMGYGGSIEDAGRAVGRSGDEGIDGIIKEDRLGLDLIYLQAKRWENVIGRPEIQKFVGALTGQRAKKGVFITTSRFSQEAMEYVRQIEPKVVLIDGEQLADLMIDFNLGVTTIQTYEIKRLDSDYFLEE